MQSIRARWLVEILPNSSFNKEIVGEWNFVSGGFKGISQVFLFSNEFC